MKSPPIPPDLLFRSFLTVISSVLMAWFLLMIIMLALGFLVFTDYWEFHLSDSQRQSEMVETNPQAGVAPTAMQVSIVLLTAIAYFGLGYSVFLMAPFANVAHGFVVSMLVFVWLLQAFLSGSDEQKLFDLVYMLVFPIAIFIGTHFASHRFDGEVNVDD